MAELSIKIRIGNREYPMKVKAEDEERISKGWEIVERKNKKLPKPVRNRRYARPGCNGSL